VLCQARQSDRYRQANTYVLSKREQPSGDEFPASGGNRQYRRGKAYPERPYIVSGDVPVQTQTIITDAVGESESWLPDERFPGRKASRCAAAARRKTSRSAMARMPRTNFKRDIKSPRTASLDSRFMTRAVQREAVRRRFSQEWLRW
jgi:hypothetical protein